MSYLFTSESVFAGHPDKVCDQVSDAILDYVLQLDPDARVACECTISPGLFHIMGEITAKTEQSIPYQEIARETLRFIGYDNDEAGFNCDTCSYIINVVNQSPDIAAGVDRDGAGDQGMMFGYATNETENYMPIAQQLANNISVIMFSKYKNDLLPWALPDGKCQITVQYDDNGNFEGVDTIVVSAQHKDKYSIKEITPDITNICNIALQGYDIKKDCKFYINPTGKFVKGGPAADTGLTGRKIVVDTYGGYAPHGGGAFSGKDSSKVDRSGAYMARYVAKNLVASGVCDKCMIQVAYIIGQTEPASININCFGTEKKPIAEILEAVNQTFDFAPRSIIHKFDLKHTHYLPYACFGHFGRIECNSPWEQLDKVEELKTIFNFEKEN